MGDKKLEFKALIFIAKINVKKAIQLRREYS